MLATCVRPLCALGLAATFLSAQPSVPLNLSPSRVLGQNKITNLSQTPNLAEGREMYWPTSVAIDTSSTPSIIYVTDSRNHRVLAWRNLNAASGTPADLVIGQRDRSSAQPKGPGTDLATGFTNPSAVAVDTQGNLYVSDSGNNRILRFPKPFTQDPEFLAPDMVIGQRNFNENLTNQGSVTSEVGLRSRDSGLGLPIGLAFDLTGNLWATDPLNHRVVRYPAAALQAGRNGPAADLVLGVASLTTQTNDLTPFFQQGAALRKDVVYQPSGVAVDRRGRVYVRDWMSQAHRVLVWEPPFGREASRLLGIPPVDPNQPRINETVFGLTDTGNQSVPRPGVTVFNGFVYVPDAVLNRVLVFDPFENWAAETTQRISPAARGVIGQDTFNLSRPNRGRTEPFNNGLAYPVAVAATQNEIFVADMQNNRVLAFPGSGTGFNPAVRAYGQDRLDQAAPNLIEGKEFYFYDFLQESRIPVAGNEFGGTCVALDGNRLYVADPANHRVLAYADVRRAKAGDSADLVIGQADLTRSSPNWPNGDADQPSQTGLLQPTCVAVDPDSNLWVADSGNGRVLRFPKPFEQPANTIQRANLVLGQLDFTRKVTDPTNRTMRFPAGLAFLSDGTLLVSDTRHHRVLRFHRQASGEFQSGQTASGVFGQANFTDSVRRAGRELNRLSNPRGIAVDSSDRLYVCEMNSPAGVTTGDRVSIFSEAGSLSFTTNPTARQQVEGLSGPNSVYVNKDSGEIWIASTATSTVLAIPRFEDIVGATITPTQRIVVPLPFALTFDSAGSMITADAFQRVSFYYPRTTALSAATPERATLAPMMYASLYGSFGTVTRSFTEEPNPLPMPTTVADTQVFFNEIPAPIQIVTPGQINVIVPQNVPVNEQVEITVVRRSTGQILAATTVQMDVVSPGLFATGTGGTGQVAALNQDNTVNSSSNPAARGSVIQLFGTGAGVIPSAPPDGAVVGGQTNTPFRPQVNINGRFVNDSDIVYSGLTPGAIALWQINVRIPDTVAPNNTVPIAIRYRDAASQARLTIAVR